jgi:hypothetical protein
MIPVNLRPIQDAWKLGNHFGLAPLVLPVGLDNPVERALRGAPAHAGDSRAAPSR